MQKLEDCTIGLILNPIFLYIWSDKMNKNLMYLFIVVIIYCEACSSTPSDDSIQTAIAKTLIANPTEAAILPTFTPIIPTPTIELLSLNEIDIEEALITP